MLCRGCLVSALFCNSGRVTGDPEGNWRSLSKSVFASESLRALEVATGGNEALRPAARIHAKDRPKRVRNEDVTMGRHRYCQGHLEHTLSGGDQALSARVRVDP